MDVGTEKPATQTLVMKASIEKPGPRPHDVVSTHSAPAIEEGHITKLSDEAPNDIGWDAYQAALLMDPAEREAIAKRVKLKIDFILLPLVGDYGDSRTTIVKLINIFADVLYLPCQLFRQNVAQLRQRLWITTRSWPSWNEVRTKHCKIYHCCFTLRCGRAG